MSFESQQTENMSLKNKAKPYCKASTSLETFK